MEMDVRWHSVGKKRCDSVCVCLKNDAFGKRIYPMVWRTLSPCHLELRLTLRTRDTGLMSSRTLIQAVANRRKRLSLLQISSHQFTIRENLSSRASHSISSKIEEAKSDCVSSSPTGTMSHPDSCLIEMVRIFIFSLRSSLVSVDITSLMLPCSDARVIYLLR